MKEKLIQILKNISFITVQPDRDWRRMSAVLAVLAIASFIWNIYFYFSVQSDIKTAESADNSRSALSGAQEDEIKKTITQFENKKADQQSLIMNKGFKLEDPSVL